MTDSRRPGPPPPFDPSQPPGWMRQSVLQKAAFAGHDLGHAVANLERPEMGQAIRHTAERLGYLPEGWSLITDGEPARADELHAFSASAWEAWADERGEDLRGRRGRFSVRRMVAGLLRFVGGLGAFVSFFWAMALWALMFGPLGLLVGLFAISDLALPFVVKAETGVWPWAWIALTLATVVVYAAGRLLEPEEVA